MEINNIVGNITTKQFIEDINTNFDAVQNNFDTMQQDFDTVRQDIEQDIEDIKNDIQPVNLVNQLKSDLLNLIYPVGSYYWSSVNESPTDFIGGTWTQVKDVFILAAGDTYKVSNSLKDGGYATVTLNKNNLPPHSHQVNCASTFNGQGSSFYPQGGKTDSARGLMANTESSGSGQSFSILPPYKVAYCWCRTA
jgi:hypothetical protein